MNKFRTPVSSTMLLSKLGTLIGKLQKEASPTGANPKFQTVEKTLSEAMSLLGKYYREIALPNLAPVKISPDTPPDPDLMNNMFTQIGDDLDVVFSEFENLEGVILGNFNYMVSRLNRLNGKLKTVSSRAGDFVLYRP